MRVLCVRHGQSVANVLAVISNRGKAHGLTDLGRAQAHALAEQLRSQQVVAIYTSPLLRATETADILSAATGMGYTETDALRECDRGIVEERGDDEAWALVHTCWEDWRAGQWDSRVEGGESLADTRARFVPFFQAVTERHRDADGVVVLVGHGALFLTMLPLVLSNVDHEFTFNAPLPNTGAIVLEPDGEGWRCVEWCGTPM